jgi:uncharacterized protein YecE (DUF72 family)
VQVAVEFRHPSWQHQDIFALLRTYGAAYCAMSCAHLRCVLRTTAGFVYVRMHCPDENNLYSGSYTYGNLMWWADRIREWQQRGKDVFVYFNNNGDAHAVRNAGTLRSILSQ